jgi:AcrR family transcriptional regulator
VGVEIRKLGDILMENFIDGFNSRKIETRQKIIEASINLFSTKGYHNTQIMDIVKTVGMSAGTFYNYFKDKRELFRKISEYNLKNLKVSLKELRKSVRSNETTIKLAHIYESYNVFFEYINNNSKEVMLALRGSFGVDEEFDKEAYKQYNYFADDISYCIQKWIDKGWLTGIDSFLVGQMIIGMLNRIAHCYLAEKKIKLDEAVNLLKSMTKSLIMEFVTEEGHLLLLNTEESAVLN